MWLHFYFIFFPELSLQSVIQHTLLPCFAVFFFFSLQCWQLLQDNIFAILIMLKEHVNDSLRVRFQSLKNHFIVKLSLSTLLLHLLPVFASSDIDERALWDLGEYLDTNSKDGPSS